MKRIIALLAILLIALQASATPVSESAAKSLAEKFLQSPSAAKLAHKGLVPSQTVGVKRLALKASAASNPAYYVFNFDGGGWVIVSGEDSVEPVIGYSTTGKFSLEGAPSNIRWWMEGRASEIGAIRSGIASPKAAVRKSWKNPRTGKNDNNYVVKYNTAQWNQEEPYNDECPEVGGKTAVSGCVATAGAIVARHFCWPDAGVGTTEAYSYTSDDTHAKVNIPAVTLGRSYDWNNMLLSYGNSYTPAQGAAVAALMVDIGKASMMAYNYDAGSGTFDQCLLLAFQKHFKYNKQAYVAFRASYTDEQWIDMLKQNLANVGPMVYGGADSEGGHEFVFDGYDADNYFSVNWGWGGSDNGKFLIDALTIESMNWTFSEGHSSIFNLEPDRNGTTAYRDQILLTKYNDTYKGLYTTTTSFNQNQSFTMKVYAYYNNATMPFNGKLYIAVYDKNGNWKENVSSAKTVSNLENAYISYVRGDYNGADFCWDTWSSVSCKITQPIKGGDRLRLHYEGQYSSGYARGDEDEDTIWEIVLKDIVGPTSEEIAAATSFGWNKSTRTINTSCSLDDGISMTMKNASGQAVYSIGSMNKNQAYSINCSTFAPGTYTLVYRGGEDYTLTLTL
ncbi:MAG: C10 family peptidase [Bacteroidales bacterium]|nr:C10 family peptidase [Bacteroidales bacterium]